MRAGGGAEDKVGRRSRCEEDGEASDVRHVEVRRHERLEVVDVSWHGRLERSRLVVLWRQEEVVVAVIGNDSRGHSSQDLGRYRRLVVGDVVLGDELLDLRGREHPADVAGKGEWKDAGQRALEGGYERRHALDDVDVGLRTLLELEQLGGLHEMLELENSLGHVVRLAPLLEPGDVVLDLHRCKEKGSQVWI